MTSPTGNPYIDSILWGNWHWDINPTLKYYFGDDYSAWASIEKAAYRAALDAWAGVANITVEEVWVETDANMVEYNLSDAQMRDRHDVDPDYTLFGKHETPEKADERGDVDGRQYEEGWYNYEQYGYPTNGSSNSTYYPEGLNAETGGFGYRTFLHELGHALGLAHPHDNGGDSPLMPGVRYDEGNDLGDHDLNQGVFTVMSYNRGWETEQNPQGNGISDYGYNSGPGAFDIAAVQYLYGADLSNHGGNTVYRLGGKMGWQAIWDTGGTDKIKYTGNNDAVINLKAAPLDGGPNAGGYLSHVDAPGKFGGFTIAADFTDALADKAGETGVLIENATGGNGNDLITGNKLVNLLKGSGGHDKILAGSGADKVFGGTGRDTLKGGGGGDRLVGGGAADKLYGQAGSDVLYGKNGGDRLDGGAGDDGLFGGDSADKFVFRAGYDADLIWDFEDNTDILALDNTLWSGHLSARQVINNFARDLGDDVALEFGGGDVLFVLGVDDAFALVDDIVII